MNQTSGIKNLVYRTDNIKCELIDGILHVKYLPDNVRIDYEKAKLMLADRKKFTAGKNFPFLVDVRNVEFLTTEARRYWATDEATEDVQMGAIVSDKTVGVVVANFFLKMSKPKVKAKLFTDIDQALIWLKQEMNDERV